MIRAHLATFPPRRRLLRKVVEAILPQVDHLFVVLNGYDGAPAYLRKHDRITAVIPDRDVKDAGKFWFAPAPDDIVFTIDDDIGYPPDYVARTLELIGPQGVDGRIHGYQAHAFAPDARGRAVWHNYLFREALAEMRGATFLGTGTLCARGDAIAPLDAIEPLAGAADFAYGAWAWRQRLMPWALPRPAEWLRNILPRELRPSSLFVSVARARHPEHMAALRSFARGWPHANLPFDACQANVF